MLSITSDTPTKTIKTETPWKGFISSSSANTIFTRGEDLQSYMFTHEANKGYGNSLTAPVDVVTEEYAKHLMLSLCETVGTRLRGDNVKISVVSVHITTCEFQYAHKQMQILTPTDVTEEIYTTACRIFKNCGMEKHP